MSSDEDENGKIKKHKLPFDPTQNITTGFDGKPIQMKLPNEQSNSKNQAISVEFLGVVEDVPRQGSE